MENYTKGKITHEPLQKDEIPSNNLPDNFLWMQVKTGSKISKLLSLAIKEIASDREVIVWTGVGLSVTKTITCAEILKKKFKNLHQETKLCYKKGEQFWEPKTPELERITVTKKVPVIHIVQKINK